MKPTNTRNYQTAEQALNVILQANKLGQSVKIDHNGDLFRAALPSNKLENFFLLFRKKSNSTEAKQSPEVLRTVINKMKIEIGIASTHLKDKKLLRIPSPGKIINNYMKDVENIQTKAQISELHAQWILINKDINGAKDGMQTPMDRLEASYFTKNLKKNLTPSKSIVSADSSPTQPSDITAKINAVATASSKSSDEDTKVLPKDAIATEQPTSHSTDNKMTHVPVSVSKASHKLDVKPTTSTHTLQDDMATEINRALPYNLQFSGNYNEIVKATLTLPEDKQKKLYATLTDQPATIPLTKKPIQSTTNSDDGLFEDIDLENDHPITNFGAADNGDLLTNEQELINKQTEVDFGRATFIIEDEEGLITTHQLGADPEDILDDMKGLVNEYGPESRHVLKTISHLPNQKTIAILLTPIITSNLTKDDKHMLYAGDLDAEEHVKLSQITYKLKRHSDGNLEFNLLYRKKISDLILSDGSMIAVNNQSSWKGDVDENNFGIEMSTKIEIPKEDLIAGTLDNVSIIEPLSVKFQFQFNQPKT